MLDQLLVNDDNSGELGNKTPKVIIFVAGGISYNEIRAIRNLECTRNAICILGGSHIMNPN